jgi:hypothetical protein
LRLLRTAEIVAAIPFSDFLSGISLRGVNRFPFRVFWEGINFLGAGAAVVMHVSCALTDT